MKISAQPYHRKITWSMTRDEAQRVAAILESAPTEGLESHEVSRWAWDLRHEGDLSVAS